MAADSCSSVDWRSFAVGAAAPFFVYAAAKLARFVLASSRQPLNSSPQGLKVVVTGSTKGLGLHLARQHLALGDDIVIVGRRSGTVRVVH